MITTEDIKKLIEKCRPKYSKKVIYGKNLKINSLNIEVKIVIDNKEIVLNDKVEIKLNGKTKEFAYRKVDVIKKRIVKLLANEFKDYKDKGMRGYSSGIIDGDIDVDISIIYNVTDNELGYELFVYKNGTKHKVYFVLREVDESEKKMLDKYVSKLKMFLI